MNKIINQIEGALMFVDNGKMFMKCLRMGLKLAFAFMNSHLKDSFSGYLVRMEQIDQEICNKLATNIKDQFGFEDDVKLKRVIENTLRKEYKHSRKTSLDDLKNYMTEQELNLWADIKKLDDTEEV